MKLPLKQKMLLAFLFWVLWLPVAQAGYPGDAARFEQLRAGMMLNQIQKRGVIDPAVLKAMQAIPRHLFVPKLLRAKAYGDHPLPIGEGQTISQPYIVALMTATLALAKDQRILEIGTGSGYQAAILSQVTDEVFSIEIKNKLYLKSTRVLKSLNLKNVYTRHGDGYFGWPEKAPFDAIMITAAVNHIPPPLLEQLKDGGRLILPLGNPFSYQNLVLVTKTGDDYTVKQIIGVLFVPMTGFALHDRN